MNGLGDFEPRTNCLSSLDVLILAGGLGTRIRPVLGDIPKLLAPIAGRPYLWHLLRWLRRFGARRIVLSLGHAAQPIIDYVRDNAPSDLVLETVVEPYPMGTAGAIRFSRQALHTDPVLIMNGDSFADADLCALVARHAETNAPATILCAEVDDGSRYGRVLIDPQGRIERFAEKDAGGGTATINAGVYVFSASLLDQITAGDAVSLERDVFERLPPGTPAAFAGRFNFIDIGTPESLAIADQLIDADR